MMKRTFIATACLLLLGLWGCPSPLDGSCAVSPNPPSVPVALLVVGEPKTSMNLPSSLTGSIRFPPRKPPRTP